MNREELRALGLTDEQIEKVLESHGKTIKADKEKLVDYEELKTAKEGFEKQISDLSDQLTATSEKYANYDENIEGLNAKVKDYEVKNLKYKIANEAGIPLELANRLSGETEEDLKKDAETLKSFVPAKAPLPLKSTEKDVDDENAPYRGMLNNLKLD